MGAKGDIRMGRKIDDLFGSMRMILPEHKAEIQRMNAERGLVERPVVDEIDFDENCFRIYDSTQYDYAISVKWFREVRSGLGVYETTWGVVKEIDANNRRFRLVSDWNSTWIRIEDVVSVTASC
jgi:YolD-like protein